MQLPDPAVEDSSGTKGWMLSSPTAEAKKGAGKFAHSTPRWFGVHVFLLGSKTPCMSFTGSAGFGFLWMAAIPLLWTLQPALLSPHVPVTGFVMKIHFILEMMLLGHRHSQDVKTAASKIFPRKSGQRQGQSLKWDTNIPFPALPLAFSLDTTWIFFRRPKISRNVVLLCHSTERAVFSLIPAEE